MSWEIRNKRKYYYRVQRNGKYLIKTYCGSGAAAKRAAYEDSQRREAREKERAVRKQFLALDAQLKDLTTTTITLTKAVLYGAGYHEHKREWRRRRINTINEGGRDFMENSTLTLEAETSAYDTLETLVNQAQQGDTTTLPAIRKILDGVPEVWNESRIIASQIERSWIETISGRDLISQEILEREVEALRTQLSGANPSPLEALLIERICACWLAVQHAEFIASKRLTPHTCALSNAEENRLDKTNRRLLAAIRELAKVRKLLTPEQKVQVNIGAAQQITA